MLFYANFCLSERGLGIDQPTMRAALLLLLAAALVLAFLVAPADAYRKRKGHGYKTPFWTKPHEDDLKIEVTVSLLADLTANHCASPSPRTARPRPSMATS